MFIGRIVQDYLALKIKTGRKVKPFVYTVTPRNYSKAFFSKIFELKLLDSPVLLYITLTMKNLIGREHSINLQ